jgi:UDP-2,3-diacylglucosamine pyrophosphatase LpxH
MGWEQMGKCFFISDLHLFANRSKASKYLDEMTLAATQAENFVLGGDIFDFRWARTSNHRHTVDKAVAWLTDLIRTYPECHFHFVLGNHDYHHALIDRLADLSKKWPNFTWYRYYMRLGNSIFLHGDVLTRLHKPFPHLVYSKRIVARRILSYLDEIGQGPESGVCNVYFGHTHKHMTNYAYGGLIFHCGGAPIKGLKFRILEAII